MPRARHPRPAVPQLTSLAITPPRARSSAGQPPRRPHRVRPVPPHPSPLLSHPARPPFPCSRFRHALHAARPPQDVRRGCHHAPVSMRGFGRGERGRARVYGGWGASDWPGEAGVAAPSLHRSLGARGRNAAPHLDRCGCARFVDERAARPRGAAASGGLDWAPPHREPPPCRASRQPRARGAPRAHARHGVGTRGRCAAHDTGALRRGVAR